MFSAMFFSRCHEALKQLIKKITSGDGGDGFVSYRWQTTDMFFLLLHICEVPPWNGIFTDIWVV